MREMNTVTIELPVELVESLLHQAKRELALFASWGLTPAQVKDSPRTFYVRGEYLPIIAEACKPKV